MTATFVNTSARPFATQHLVAFAQTTNTQPLSPPSKSDYNDILNNTPLWRTSFFTPPPGPLKLDFTSQGDIAS